MTNSILRLPDVKMQTGFSRSTIYLLMSKNKFPKSIQLGPRAVGWLESDIQTWISEKINKNLRGGNHV